MARWLGARGVVWLARVLDVLLIVVVVLTLLAIVLGRLVPLTGHQSLVVAGGSMEPTIQIGSAVITEPVSADALRVGDVVSLRSGAQRAIFTHRIIRIAERDGATWIETRGDANGAPDPSITPASAVIGRVVTVIPYAGFLIALLSIPSGVIFVLALGALLLMATWSLDDLAADLDPEDLDADDLGAEPVAHPAG